MGQYEVTLIGHSDPVLQESSQAPIVKDLIEVLQILAVYCTL